MLTIHHYEGHIEEDEEGGARGTRGRDKTGIQNSGRKPLHREFSWKTYE